MSAHKRGKSEGLCSKGRKQEEENVDKQEDMERNLSDFLRSYSGGI